MVGPNAIAIIPARGGSKRIPHKNIIDFRGQPLIQWTIKAALETGIFKRIFVSTDDRETARIAEANGVEIPFLRRNYCDDKSPVSLATVDALEQFRDILNESYNTVVQLMPNCPLRNSNHIADAYEHFRSKSVSFQISCFKFGWMNPWWAVRLTNDGTPQPLFPSSSGQRSQDLEELYCPTGAVWIANCDALLKERTFYGAGHNYHAMDWKAAIDIDSYDDLALAEAVFEMQRMA